MPVPTHAARMAARRLWPAALALSLAMGLAPSAPALAATAASTPEPFADLLEASLKDRKGVVVYVKGQAIAGRVTRLAPDAVELSSREFNRIVLRRDAIDGVAGN